MDIAKSIKITCKPEALESFWLRCILEYGNNQFAKEIGVHPSTSSRDKNRIFKLACKAAALFGLPEGSVELPEQSSKIVFEGEYAEMLIQALERKGKVKRKAPTVTEASNQIEISI